MDVEDRIALVKRNTIELVGEDELRVVFATKEQPLAYIGFEPSGLVHMGWALVTGKIKDLCDAGFKVIIFWADWHAYINDKLGGNLENIRACARYMEDCFIALGVPRDKVEFKYASEILDDITYWEKLIKIGKVTSLSRVKRAMTIMGRKEDEAELDSSKVVYPLMQATDIFHLGVDMSYAGIDQRRANMLARDAAEKLGWQKPIALHTPLLPGLRGGSRMNPENVKGVEKVEVCKTVNDGIESKVQCMIENKMSKSDPTSSINIHDDRASVQAKFKKAYCPPEQEKEDENPILMLAKYVVFPRLGKLDIERPEKYGGNVSYASYEALTADYFGGKLSPVDLKTGMAEGVSKVLDPVAAYFQAKPENYLKMQEILKSVGKLR